MTKRRRATSLVGEDTTANSLPWFALPKPLPKGAAVAIIGAGIAGISCFQALLRAGFKPVIFERGESLGAGGSGNAVGLIQPRLTTSDSLDGQFNATAYLHAVQYYSHQENILEEVIWHGSRGGIQLARNAGEDKRFQKLVDEARLPASEMEYMNPTALSEMAGIDIHQSGLYFKNAGALRPVEILKILSRDMDIHFKVDVEHIERRKSAWYLLDRAGNSLGEFDAVILTNAHEATKLGDIRDVPLTAKRGQVSFLPASEASQNQNCGLSFGRYVTPPFDLGAGQKFHVVGASYCELGVGEIEAAQNLNAADHVKNLEGLSSISKSYDDVVISTSTKGRASIRATTIDHWPVLGGVQDGDICDQHYFDLRHGKPAHNYPEITYQTGLYCMTGLGSRGLQMAPLLSTALAGLLAGSPNVLEKRFLDAIHPARFQIRKLKRKVGR